jgi:hypothetical protein
MTWILATLLVASMAQQPATTVEMTAAEKEFQQTMTNVTLVGHYTVGDGTQLFDDRYVIQSVSKVKDGLWRITARVQYGKKDMVVTLDMPVYFAGDTPVMSLTRQAVQGLGTYDTRLVIYKGGYAGTWGGGAGGGKMFGNIVKNDPAKP